MATDCPNIEIKHIENVTIIDLLDEEILEESTISDISESLFPVVDEANDIKLLLNFEKVKHFSSSALGMLIRLNQQVEEKEGQLKLCHIRKTLFEVFSITKLDRVFEIYASQEDAMASF